MHDRELEFIMTRMRIKAKIVVGHWQTDGVKMKIRRFGHEWYKDMERIAKF